MKKKKTAKQTSGKRKTARKPKWRDLFGVLDRPFEMYAMASESSDQPPGSSSSSSSGVIYLKDTTGIELTNPFAGDWTTHDLSYVNTTGRKVQWINIDAWLTDKGKDSGNPLSVIQITKGKVMVKTTYNLPENGGGITGSATFLDEFMKPMATSSFTLEGMKTLKYAATQTVGDTSFGSLLSASIGPKLAFNTDEQGFTSPTAGATAAASFSETVTSGDFELKFRTAFTYSIANLSQPQNISLSLQTGVSVTQYYDLADFGTWAFTGAGTATWNLQSNNQVTLRAEITAGLVNYDGASKKFDLNTSPLYFQAYSERMVSPGGSSKMNFGGVVGLRFKFK